VVPAGYSLGVATTDNATSDRRAEVQTPGTPVDLESRGWKAIIRPTLTRCQGDRVTMMAGSIAYHGFLALFPTVIALIGITQLVGLGGPAVASLVRGIGKALPPGASDVLTTAVKAAQQRTSGALTVTILAVLVAVWSASGGMAVVQSGLNIAYDVAEDRRFVKQRAIGLLLLLVTIVLGGSASALVVFAKPLGGAIASTMSISDATFNVPWTVLRWVVTIILIITLFAFLYAFATNRNPPHWAWFSPGGVIGAIVWLSASFALSFYVSELGSYGKTYGALAGVAVLLLWFYLTALAVLLGAEFNASIERQAAVEGVPTGAEPPQSAPSPTAQ
jgi:membrane protein